MKQIKSTLEDLKTIVNLITVKYIAEFDLETIIPEEKESNIREIMDDKDFDIMPIESNNKIIGYVEKNDLSDKDDNKCLQKKKDIVPSDLIPESTSLINLFSLFKNRNWFFVLYGGEIRGIVTKGDLRKIPIRMYLFALINLIEMHLTKKIKEYCPTKDDLYNISENRMKKAEEILKEKQCKNEALDIYDCLQFCDKKDISLENKEIFCKINIMSKKEMEQFLNNVINLRNKLAHGNDIVDGTSWSKIFEITNKMEELIRKCEERRVY